MRWRALCRSRSAYPSLERVALRAGMMTVNVSDLRPWSGGRYRTTAGMSPWCRLRSKPSASWRALISTLTVPSPFFVTALAAAALRPFPSPSLGSPAVRARRRPPRRRRRGHVRAELQPRGRRAGQAEFDQMSAFRSWLSASRSPGNSQSSALRASSATGRNWIRRSSVRSGCRSSRAEAELHPCARSVPNCDGASPCRRCGIAIARAAESQTLSSGEG